MEHNTYRIKTLPAGTESAAIDWSAVPAAAVRHYFWYEGYTPAVTARLVYIQGDRFVLRMECAESNPKAIYTEYMQDIYKDSCLEFFADWLSDGRYINMEMNANGALLSCIGPDRHNRTPVKDICGEIFPVAARVEADAWSVTAEIPLTLLAAILGVPSLDVQSGFAFRGNFYKCGDETAVIHFGMWNPIGTEKADFHRPEYFGDLIVD